MPFKIGEIATGLTKLFKLPLIVGKKTATVNGSPASIASEVPGEVTLVDTPVYGSDVVISVEDLNLDFTSGVLDSRVTFTRSTTGTYVNSSGVLTSAAIDTPRFDYDPVTLAAKGLLIEEQRTNICLYSSDLTNIAWVIAVNASVTGDASVAPDGTTTADTITVNGSNNGVFQSIACSSSTAYTFSLYVKLGTMSASDYKIAIYDNTNAAFIAADIIPTQTPSATAWTRVTYTFTTPATCVSVRVYCFRNGLSAATSVNVWGMQLELGAFATSVIPTTTAAATRAADVAGVTGANFSSWYNQAEGTTLVEAATLPNVTATVITYAISDGTFNQSIYGTFSTGNTYRGANVLDGGVAQANLIANFTGLTTTNNTKDAFAYKLNDFAESCNGVATRTDTAGTVPAVNRLYIGSSWSGNSNFLNGHIRSFKYYPTRLSNAELQSLTAARPIVTYAAAGGSPSLWTPAQITTAVWLDAADASTITLNGSTVSQWADKSGNGRNVVQATASAQPTSGTRTLNSLNTLDFDGDDWLRYNTPFLTINTEWLLYSVIIFDSLTNGPVYVGVKGAQTTHMGWALSPGNQAIYNDVIGTSSLSNTGVISIGNAAIMGVQYDTTNITGIFNGTTQLSSAATFTADTANFVVGTHSNTATNFLDGAFGEIVFIQSSVSLSNRQKLEGYLAWKWGLQANLPVGHPYKAAAPTV